MVYLANHSKSTKVAQEPLMVNAYELSTWKDFQRPQEMLLKSSKVLLHSSKVIEAWNEKETSVAILFEKQLQWLRRHYVFREEAEVQQILRRDPALLQLLIDAYSRIEAHFPNSQVFLEVAIDPETVDNNSEMIDSNEELVASICTHLSPEGAIEALKKFYNAWWLKASKEVKGKISIGLECL